MADRGGGTARRATYRLQLSRDFGFAAAAGLCGCLRDLGVSHLYLSPVMQAAPGSSHGYDVVDPTRICEELGGERGFRSLLAATREAGLSLLVDIVPNHMSTSAANPWWWDVLARGVDSRYATWFDIDWEAQGGRVLLPVLGDHLGRAVDSGELRVETGELRYHEQRFPLRDASSTDDIVAMLDAQPCRIARWRVALREVNYRRFFEINSLVGMRVEDAEVFEATHAPLLDMLRRGDVDGVRVDHVDGLRLPAAYLRRLRAAAGEGAWIVVEKILDDGETLPAGWPVQGTTGYEFASLSTRVMVDPRGEAPLVALLREMGGSADIESEARNAKLQAMEQTLAADLLRLVALLRRVCARRPRHRDHTDEELRVALAELIAALPVYRSYAEPGVRASMDGESRLRRAMAAARRARPEIDAELLDLVVALVADNTQRDDDEDATDLVLRFQQVSSAVMAKGVEDTAFYRVVTLVALNEVGGGPRPFGASVSALHAHNARMQERWPESLLATTTHDTKRSEDVRARLALLSEIPAEWAARVRAWRDRNARHRRGPWPDGAAELLLYQSMVGAWPVDRGRMLAYMEKASREAKLHTSWIDPVPEYDEALRDFVDALYDDAGFLADVEAFVEPLVTPGRVNALAMALLKLTSPGVPDIYQGCESWALSLVDPDNRRPVNYEEHRALLERSRTTAAAQAWRDDADSGLPKLLLTRRALQVRARWPELFGREGAYTPLRSTGARSDNVIAFARGGGAVTVVPRLVLSAGGDWGDTAVRLPDGEWFDQLGDRTHSGEARAAKLFEGFPVALLAREPYREAA